MSPSTFSTASPAALLHTVRRHGDFYTSGAAELAPFGRGEQTLIDTAVHRTWQIGPAYAGRTATSIA